MHGTNMKYVLTVRRIAFFTWSVDSCWRLCNVWLQFDFPSKYYSRATGRRGSFGFHCHHRAGLCFQRNTTKCFDVVVALAWPEDPEGFADGRVATVRICHARRVNGDDPAEKGYTGRPGWVFGVRPTSPHIKKFGEKPSNITSHGTDDMMIWL